MGDANSENVGGYATSQRDGDAFAALAPLQTHANDAVNVDASIDTLLFDSSLSFLDNLDELNAILDDDASFLEPPLLVADSTTAPTQVLNGFLSLSTDDDDRGGDLRRLEPVVDPISPPEPAKPTTISVDPAKPPTTATTSRARQKEEIEYLRAQVVDLESELSQLKSDPECSSVLTEPSVWEKIAKRQSEAKQRATIENAKLRELLEGQLKVARSLERLLNKRSLTESTCLSTNSKRPRVSRFLDDEAELEAIRARVHSHFDDVDVIMEECGLSRVFSDLDDAQATTIATADSAICMEMMVTKVFPFPLEQVAEIVWQCVSSNHIELPTGYFGASQRSESMCNLHFAIQVRLRRAEAVIHVQGVGARRVDAERSMIVFEAVGVTKGTLFADGPVRCRERAYILIEKHPASCSSGSSPSTIVKTCSRLWPERADTEDEDVERLHFGAFIDLVIGSYNQNTKKVLEIIENSLLEQSFSRGFESL